MHDPGTSTRSDVQTRRLPAQGCCPPRRGSDPQPVYDLRNTLDLESPAANSNDCFVEVEQFADECVACIESRACTLIDGYASYVREVLSEPPRSRAEYALEFLALGMALRNYEAAVEAAPAWTVALGRTLVAMRGRFPAVKPLIDKIRAILCGVWPDPVHAGTDVRRPPRSPINRSSRLIAWLQATGEFEQEALRLANWRSYLNQFGPAKFAHWLNVAVELFDRFSTEATDRLGIYTRGVDSFLAGDYAHRGLREDRLFCGRLPSEYHFNMVAAEVMNRGLREAFERTTQKVVLVPACMRGAKATRCRARIDGVDIACSACDAHCAVNRITQKMRALGARVYIVPHATGFSRWLTRWQREPGVGVAAVACLLNILAGGYDMRGRRIASQCVPLDFPGCRKHWGGKGRSTGVNEDRLVQIVTSQIVAS